MIALPSLHLHLLSADLVEMMKMKMRIEDEEVS